MLVEQTLAELVPGAGARLVVIAQNSEQCAFGFEPKLNGANSAHNTMQIG